MAAKIGGLSNDLRNCNFAQLSSSHHVDRLTVITSINYLDHTRSYLSLSIYIYDIQYIVGFWKKPNQHGAGLMGL